MVALLSNLETRHLLPARPPYRFEHSAHFLECFLPAAGEQEVRRDFIGKAFRCSGHTVWCELRGAKERVEARLVSERPLPAAATERVLQRLAFFLSLDDDLLPFYALAREDPALVPALALLDGYHQVKFPTAFEAACWAILTQRCPIPVARRRKDRITERWGGALEVSGKIVRAFPEPGDLLPADEGELAAVLGHALQARRLRSVIETFARLDEAFLARGPRAEVERVLGQIEGIGPWSLAFVMVRALGRMDSIEGSEAQLLPAIAEVYGREVKTAADVRRLAARYGEHRGYWALYAKTSAAIRARAT